MNEVQLKNFGLTEAEFERMTAELRQGGGQLFEKIFLAHFRECCAYLENQCSASPADAYDACMETLLQFRQLLMQGKVRYQNLRFLFTRMAAQWYFRWKKKTPVGEPVEGFEPLPVADEFDEDSMRALDLAWAQLGEQCQHLLKDFYYHGLSLVDLAKQSEQPDATLRQRKKRCVERLRELFFKISTL